MMRSLVLNKAYTGIGSRKSPKLVLTKMTAIARILQDHLIMRSGHAPGADMAFELGVTNGNKEIYIPWKGFAGSDSLLYTQMEEAHYIASQYHPNWKNLKESVKKLMARSTMQILGKQLNDPSKFVLCWTPDACMSAKTRTRKTGGTGLAISLASNLNIPIINMKYMLWEDMLEDVLNDFPFSTKIG